MYTYNIYRVIHRIRPLQVLVNLQSYFDLRNFSVKHSWAWSVPWITLYIPLFLSRVLVLRRSPIYVDSATTPNKINTKIIAISTSLIPVIDVLRWLYAYAVIAKECRNCYYKRNLAIFTCCCNYAPCTFVFIWMYHCLVIQILAAQTLVNKP